MKSLFIKNVNLDSLLNLIQMSLNIWSGREMVNSECMDPCQCKDNHISTGVQWFLKQSTCTNVCYWSQAVVWDYFHGM